MIRRGACLTALDSTFWFWAPQIPHYLRNVLTLRPTTRPIPHSANYADVSTNKDHEHSVNMATKTKPLTLILTCSSSIILIALIWPLITTYYKRHSFLKVGLKLSALYPPAGSLGNLMRNVRTLFWRRTKYVASW